MRSATARRCPSYISDVVLTTAASLAVKDYVRPLTHPPIQFYRLLQRSENERSQSHRTHYRPALCTIFIINNI